MGGVLGAQFCHPLSPANQPAKIRLEGSAPYLQQGLYGCHRVSPAIAEEVIICNLPVSLPRGSAWANTVSQYTQAILLFLYVWCKKIHVETWGGTVHSLILQNTSVWPWGFGTVTST